MLSLKFFNTLKTYCTASKPIRAVKHILEGSTEHVCSENP